MVEHATQDALADLDDVLADSPELEWDDQDANEPTFPLYRRSELKTLPPPEPLVRGVLMVMTLACLFGAEGSFKSFLALALALAIATGRDFYGHPVLQGLIVYISGEGWSGLHARIRAWELAHGIAVPDECACFIPEAPQLLSDSDVDKLLRTLRLSTAPVLVVVDTLSRAMAGGSDSSDKDVRQMVRAVERIKRETGATVLLLHHTGWGNVDRTRGSSDLPAALDTSIRVERDAKDRDRVTLHCAKQKDAEPFEPIVFRKRVVTLDISDEKGEPRTSLVFDLTDEQPLSASPKSAFSRSERNLIDYLRSKPDRRATGAELREKWRNAIAKKSWLRREGIIRLVEGGEGVPAVYELNEDILDLYE